MDYVPRAHRLRLFVFVIASAVLAVAPASAADPNAQQFVKTYCIRCHGQETQEGDVRLDDVAQLAPEQQVIRWHQVWNKVHGKLMPPEDEPQPNDDERDALLAWITQTHGDVTRSQDQTHWALETPVQPPIPTVTGYVHPIDCFVIARLQSAGLSQSPSADHRILLRRVTFDLTGLPPTLPEIEAYDRDIADPRVGPKIAYARVVERLLRSPRYGERWAQHWLDVIRWAETVGFETNGERAAAWHYRDWVIRALNDDLPYDQFIQAQLVGDTLGDDAALGFLVAGPANLPGQVGRDEEAMRQSRQDELDEVIRTVSQSLFGLTIGCARCHDHKFDPILQSDYYSMQAVFAGLRYGHRRLRGAENDRWTAQAPAEKQKLAALLQQLEQFRLDHDLRAAVEQVTIETFPEVECDAVRMEIAATDGGAASLYELEVLAADAVARIDDTDNDTRDNNVALASAGAQPSASSFALANQTRHFDNLVDGSVDPRQAFPWVAAQGGAAWVQVDFAKAARIHKVVWHSGSSTPVSFELKLRETGTNQWRTVADTRDRLLRISDRREAKYVKLDSVEPEDVDELVELLARIRAQQSLVQRLETGPQTYAASFTPEPEVTWLLKRGDPMQRARVVEPNVPEVLQKMVGTVTANSDSQGLNETQRRIALARHLTSADHPLTSRVIVNRIWQHHFGSGLVDTPSDFGRMGSVPSHPELLDWLAVQFVENRWSLKWLHGLIVTSSSYKQSSLERAGPLRVDAESRLLWRFPPRRLEAEAIRDAVLAASGKLNLAMYGPGFNLFDRRGGLSDYHAVEVFPAEGWRRMIYAHKVRMQAVDVFGAFDCPDAGQMTPKRNQSTTPIQSLGLFNSPFINRQAKFFAERVVSDTEDTAGAVDRAFQLAFARNPSDAERTRMSELAEMHGMQQVCRVLLNTSEFVFLK